MFLSLHNAQNNRTMRAMAIGMALSVMFSTPSLYPAAAQDATVKKYGDWEVSCGTPPGSRHKKCALTQSVIDEERSNVGLRVVFLLGSKGERVLRVVAPLGVLLPFGLGIRIDDEAIGDKPIPFIRCRPMGCISEIVLKDALLDKMKTGKQALFIIVETKEEGRAIPVSLAGFTKGLEHLLALSKEQ